MFRRRRRVVNRRDSRPGNSARVANFTLQKHASAICTRSPPPPPPPPLPFDILSTHPERNITSHAMVAATEAVLLSASSPVPSDAKTAVVVNGAEKPGSTTATATAVATAVAVAAKSKPKGKNQQRREKRKQKKIQSSRESSVVTESESESVRAYCFTREKEGHRERERPRVVTR